jgi:hypothetical protein
MENLFKTLNDEKMAALQALDDNNDDDDDQVDSGGVVLVRMIMAQRQQLRKSRKY